MVIYLAYHLLTWFFFPLFQTPVIPDPTQLDLSPVETVFIPTVWAFANHIINHLLVLVGIRSGIFFGMNILKQVGSMMGG